MILFYKPETGTVQAWVRHGTGDEYPDLTAIEAPDDTCPADVYVWQGQIRTLPPQSDPWTTFDPAAGAWVDMRGPGQIAADLAAAKAAAIARVNAWAAAERAKHITIIPGQDMIYLAKEAEALRYLADPVEPEALTDYPLLAAEVGITAPTAYQLAQLWAQLGHLWRGLAAQIEATRLVAIQQIEAADTEVEIMAARP